MRTFPPLAPATVAFLLCLGACQPRLSGHTVSRVIPEAVDSSVTAPEPVDSIADPNGQEYGFQTTWMPLEGLVVLEEQPGEDWAAGEPEPIETGTGLGEAATLQDVDTNALSESAKSRLRDTLWVWDGREHVANPVESLHILSLFVPHFGERQRWHGQQGEPALSDSEVNQEIARSGTRFLVGRIADRSEEFPSFKKPRTAPLVLDPSPCGEGYAKVLAAAQALPEYESNQREYQESGGEGDWWEGSLVSKAFGFTDGSGREFLWLSHFGGDECSQDAWSQTTLWSVSDSTEPELLFQTTPHLTPLMAIDADGDGSPEFYLSEFPTRRLVVRKFGEAYREGESWSYAYHDCGC